MPRRSATPIRTSIAVAFAVVLAPVMLTSCGGEATAPKAPPGSSSNPLVALPNPTPTRTPPDPEASPAGEKHSSKERSAATLSARQHAAQRADERRRARASKRSAARKEGEPAPAPRKQPLTTRPSARTPCALVTKAQAQALMGVPILEPLQAPQGPTCIYRTRSGKRFVTLAVQQVNFKRLRAQMRDARRVDVSNLPAYCGRLGQPLLVVALSTARVLSIGAPCELASRFAARAVPRLSG